MHFVHSYCQMLHRGSHKGPKTRRNPPAVVIYVGM
eukprot:COSAG02_NODE_15882_length_1133_cov_1.499033_2_plen_34_part_01